VWSAVKIVEGIEQSSLAPNNDESRKMTTHWVYWKQKNKEKQN